MALQQVTSDMLAAGAAVANIGTGGITSNEILDGTITKSDLANPMTQGTVQNSTSGTSIDFTSIPSWVKRITVMLNGVSTSGASQVRVRIGPIGGVETTGYAGSSATVNGTNLCAVQTFSAGFDFYDVGAATTLRHGSLILTLIDASTNTWAVQSIMGENVAVSVYLGGTKALAGAISIVRITTVNGTDTFDAGSINILYE